MSPSIILARYNETPPMKFNPDYAMFDDNMFVKLRRTLEGIEPAADLSPLDLSIGEPQLPGGNILVNSVARYNKDWQYYPKANGNPQFTAAVGRYIARRWPAAAAYGSLTDQIMPVTGTREPLAFLGNLVRNTKPDAVALVTNPFYHAWRAGALASGATITYMDAKAENKFLPMLDELSSDILERTTIMYICSPTNPEGSVMPMEYLKSALAVARKHDFLLVMDECYADIWRGEAPTGMLEAVAQMPSEEEQDPLRNLVVLNSLSKRSSAAGLRTGFMIGDAAAISQFAKLAANGGSLVPTPLLNAAADLYDDDEHVSQIRAHYDHSFAIAARHLNIEPPQGGFFLWLPVDDEVKFVQRLMSEQAVRAMPGSFMGFGEGASNPGRNYVRLALVHDHDRIEEAMRRVAAVYNNGVA